MRAFGVIALVVALLAVVPAAVRAHVGFEFEAAGTNVDPQSIPWYRRAFPKGYVMHDGGAWKLTTDDTKDAEYVVNPPYAEDLAGRQALCATLHAVSQDMTAMLAAYTGAGGNGVHNHAFAYRGHNYLPSNPTAFEMQITFGVQLSQARRMFAAMNVANFDFAQPNGFPFPFSITPALAACPLWGAHPLSQLSHEGQGFVLLIAAMRLGGNDNAMVYPSPKRHMDFIVHSKWALLANQLTAVHAPFGAAAPGGGAALAERAALLADDGAGRPWAANMADLLANWMMAAPGAPPVPNHAWTHGGVLGQNALGINMYAGGWTELDIDMNVQFDAWVRGILTPGLLGTHSTDLLRNNPITKIGNRIGNLDKVDTVGGQPHIIIEARRLTTVTAATVESVSLAYYDWFTRWNRHALTGVAAPRRLMNVDAGAAFPLGPPYYTTAGNGCLTRVTNTCQAHGGLGGTWNALHTAITNAETARINGAGGVAACFLEHGTESQRSGSSASGAQKLRTKVKAQKKKLRKAVAHTHVVSECGDGPTAKAAPKQQPVEPKGALPLAQSLAAFEQQFGADLKAHPEKVDPEVLEAIKFAEQHKGKAKH